MRKTWAMAMPAVAVASCAVLAPSVARADDESGVLDSRHHKRETPQNFAFELRVAQYIPNIDGDKALNGHPYGNTFGTDARFEIAAEFDWQAFRIPYVGTVGPGFSVGFTSMSAKAKLLDGTDSSEDTKLDIFPMYGVLVLRGDALMRLAHVPIVPYLKAGIGYAIWHTYLTVGNESAAGQTWGTHLAFGGALNLDVFDPTAARNLDTEVGINHSYLFFEYFMSDLEGLGKQNVLFVGTRNIAGGLAFEF